MLIKGTKISLLKQRDKLTGGEFIPFQEKWSNGKLNMKAIINHFSDVTDQNISLLSLVNIKQFINNESELDSMTSEPWDVYYSRLDKKLYMYSYNEDTQEGSYESSEPTSNQLYVMLTPLDEEKSNAVYRWDKDTKQFVAPSYVDDVVDVYAVYTASPIGELSNIHLYSDKDRTTPILGETGKLYINKNDGEPEHLFRWNGTEYSLITDGGPLIIGEIENTAYDGAKGKHNADVLNSLPDTIIYAVQDYTNDASQVKLNYSFKRKKEDGTFANATNASKTLPTASKTEAGVMTAADKAKVDIINTTGDGTKYLSDNGTYNLVEDEIIKLPAEIFSLSTTSTSDEIFEAFGGKETLLSYVKNNKKKAFTTLISHGREMYTVPVSIVSNYINDNNLYIILSFNIADSLMGMQIYMEDNVAFSTPISMIFAEKDVTFSLPNNIVSNINKFTNNANSVTLNYTFSEKRSGGMYVGYNTSSSEIPAATASKAGVMTAADKAKVDIINTTGDGTKYLSDDGTYKTIESGGADKEEVYTFRNSIDGEISLDEFNSIKLAILLEKLIMVPLMFAFAGSNLGPLVPTNCYSDDNGITMHHVIAAMNGEAQIANIHISNDLTITTDNIDTLSRNEVLTKTNINAYTPTKEYHPATKLYVDDTVTTALNNVVTLDTSLVITGRKLFEGGIYVEGRVNGNGDDEGIVVGRASNNYSALTLGEPLEIHSTFYLHPDNRATWRYNNGSTNFDIEHPYKNGTIALTSDLSDLQNTISSLQSQIASLESQLSSKASQSSLDSVSGRVSTIESQYVKSDNIRNITKKTSSEYASLTKDANTMYAVVD